MSEPTDTPVVRHPLRLADLPQRKTTRVSLRPTPAQMAELGAVLGLDALRKLSFTAELTPLRGADWQLTAALGATVVQPCRVSLEPVTTRIEETVVRHYLSSWQEAQESEAEMPEDDTAEPLPSVIDLGAVMEEALALAIPAFPRADGVEDLSLAASPPGAAPLTEETVKPFAGLADLKAKLERGED